MKLEKTFYIDANHRDIAQVLCSDAFNVEAERIRRETVLSTRFELLEQSDQRTRFEMHSMENDRNKRGKIDRSRVVPTVTRFEWTPDNRTMCWTYDGVGRGFLDISGSFRLTPAGNGTRVTHRIDVDVNVPFIGRLIAGVVSGVFKESFPAQDALLRAHVGERRQAVAA